MLVSAINTIDTWYKSKCDDLWEHNNGITLATTDNPGWMVTVNVSLGEEECLKINAYIGQQYGAQCEMRNSVMHVFSENLGSCLEATAYILSAYG